VLPSDCLWSDWLVDCSGHWQCTQGLCSPACTGGCGNGVCEPAKGEDAWTCAGDCTACSTNADCAATQLCEWGQGACQAPGSCLNKPVTCPLTWAPVCGCDGVTYPNACTRRQAGVGEAYAGECSATACEAADDCLGQPWTIKCYGHWTCVAKACTPECGGSCGDNVCDGAKGEDALTCDPDCGAPEPTAFRALTLEIVAPKLCVGGLGGAGCVLDATPAVNQAIAAQLADPADPLDLLGVFTPLDLSWTTALFDLQDGTCTRDPAGTVLTCSPTTGATPNTFASPVFSTGGDCVSHPSTISAPCFSSKAEDARFKLLGVLFGLLDPLVAGTFVGDTVDPFQELAPGLIHGFLPKSLAEKIAFTAFILPVTLADLLSHEPTVVHEGTAGWWLTLSYTASVVPYAP
jgi:hypothetical protein